MPTISDVAQLAGVSRTSVSFAFNDPSRLSTATRDRILQAAEQLGYYPDPVARSMTSKRVGALGLLVPQRSMTLFANPFFAELLRGIGCVCDRHDFSILVVSPIEGSLTRALQRAAADGFVVVGMDRCHPAFHLLQQRGVPFVTVSSPPVATVPSVNIDDCGGATCAAAHLIALGHREILTIRLRPPHSNSAEDTMESSGHTASERLAGYRQAFADADLAFPEELVIPADSTIDGGRQAFRTAWLAGARPTAVLAMSDIMALGVLQAASELQLRVPDDLAIVGFDDIPAAQVASPSLTTVRQSAIEVGSRAATMLIDHPSGHQEAAHVVLPTTLIIRGSTGNTPVRDTPDASPSTGFESS